MRSAALLVLTGALLAGEIVAGAAVASKIADPSPHWAAARWCVQIAPESTP